MSNKYKKSFKVDADEIPGNCPFCKNKLDRTENLLISPYKDGFRAVLMCPKCNFQKVIAYELEGDDYEENCEVMSKEDMLEELDEHNWKHELTGDSSWEEVKEEYDIMIDECTGDSPLFPNGRDYDAEDEDSPF